MPGDHQIAVGQDLGDQRRQCHVDVFLPVHRTAADIGTVRAHLHQVRRIHALGQHGIQTEEIGQVGIIGIGARAAGAVLELGGIGNRDIDGDDVADMAGAGVVEETLGARLPQRIIVMADRGQRRNGGHELGVGGVAHRRQFRRFADPLDAIDGRAAA